MRGDLAQPGLAGIYDDRLEDRLRRDRRGPDPSALVHTPQHGPRIDAGGRGPRRREPSWPRRASGRYGTRPCLPTRSTIAQRPSRCATSANSSPANSPLRNPHPTSNPSKTRSPQPFCRFRIRLGQQPLGLGECQPVAGPDAGAAGAGDAADPGGGQGGEPAVRGGFRCELTQGGECEVDRGGRQPPVRSDTSGSARGLPG